ncbi:biotin--[acetyl-CoA-carboxylase] ligase [Wolbachia endosymbiont of Pentidionis agamae]|uniref:biotin--[acetyl-CoA-carboxylase] ligase n=1 Tax=Wolbachia endosymbiont of Pentidionis agamae TaxID=3110435 RepID=UPI002FD79790
MKEIFENFQIYHYKKISSTHLEALNLIDSGIFDETVILADEQTCGRGRIERKWISPLGNLYASFIINERTNPDRLTEFVYIISLAIGNTLLSNDINVQYKWPNDVLVDGKKIAGILLSKPSNKDWLVVSIGVNIVCAPLPHTTCISDYSAIIISNVDLLKKIIIHFNELKKKLILFSDIREAWIKRAFKMNEKININFADKSYSGIFIGIDKYGKLMLEQENKNTIYFDSGELFE